MSDERVALIAPAPAFHGYACAAAVAHLCAALDALAPTVVVMGDDNGPSAWAARWARQHPAVLACVYRTDGTVTGVDNRDGILGRWANVPLPTCAHDAVVDRATRDRHMIYSARGAGVVTAIVMRAGWDELDGYHARRRILHVAADPRHGWTVDASAWELTQAEARLGAALAGAGGA